MIKGYLFDFNGTLFFDSELHVEAAQICFRRRGLKPPTREDVLFRFNGKSNPQIYREFVNPNASDEEALAYDREKEEIYQDLVKHRPEMIKLCDGAEDFLNYLEENHIPHAMATGSPLFNVLFYNELFRLDRWFRLGENFIYADGTFPGKPKGDIYRIAAEKVGVKAEECMIFEDGTPGIRSALDAPCGKLVVVYEKNLPSPLEEGMKADIIVHDFTNWKDFCQQ